MKINSFEDISTFKNHIIKKDLFDYLNFTVSQSNFQQFYINFMIIKSFILMGKI